MIAKAKTLTAYAITSSMVRWVFNPLTGDLAIIFMLHRFNDPDNEVTGQHDPQFLDRALSWLKTEGFRFESLSDFLKAREVGNGGSGKRVIFTLDDGYRDQLSIAAPVFERHACPATIFLITDFIDRHDWLWDDKIEYILKNTEKDEINFKINHQSVKLTHNKGNYSEAVHQAREFCKKNPGYILREFMEVLAKEAEIRVPDEPPKEYQPLTWDMAHEWEKKGISFGSHGLNHAILSTLEENEVASQLSASWKRLSEEVQAPSPAFCYPTGRFGQDFGPREIHQVQNSAFNAALTSDPGYAHIINLKESERYRISRFAFPGNMRDLIQYCSGIELLKDKVRQLTGLLNH